MDEPLLGEIYAAREFRITRAGELTSLHFPTAWKQGEHQAVCHRSGVQDDPHAVPSEDCRCGFYSYTAADPAPDTTAIMGVVACYGTVLEGELGVRAEKTRIVALYFGEAVPWRAHDRARLRYGDIEIFDDYMAMLDHFDIKTAPRRASKTAEGIVYPARAQAPAPKDSQPAGPRLRENRGIRRGAQKVWAVLSDISAVCAELLTLTIRAVVVTAFLAFAVAFSIPQTASHLTQGPWAPWVPVVAAIAVVVFSRRPGLDTILHVLLNALLTSAFVGALILMAQNAPGAGSHGVGVSLAWTTVLFVVSLAAGRDFWRARFGTTGSEVVGAEGSAGAVVGGGAAVCRGSMATGLRSTYASPGPFKYAKLP